MHRMIFFTIALWSCAPPATSTRATSVATPDPPTVDAGADDASADVVLDDTRFFGDADASAGDFTLRFERTACLGPCPMYTVLVDAHGDVRFSSRLMVVDHFVDGCARSNIGDAGVAEIRRVLARNGYFSLKNVYEGGPTDAPWVNTSVSDKGASKAVRHYTAAPINAAERARLAAIEDALDRLTGAGEFAKQGGALAACVYTARK